MVNEQMVDTIWKFFRENPNKTPVQGCFYVRYDEKNASCCAITAFCLGGGHLKEENLISANSRGMLFEKMADLEYTPPFKCGIIAGWDSDQEDHPEKELYIKKSNQEEYEKGFYTGREAWKQVQEDRKVVVT